VPISEEWEGVFDEAIMSPRWANITKLYDVTFLPVKESALAALEARGFKRAVIEKERFPKILNADVPTVDFSGWFIYCRANLSDDITYLVAKAIDENRQAFNDRIPPSSGLTHPVDPTYFSKTVPIPLHDGAAKYYKEKGIL
jgi:TRAP-type uncharacterized transport system substrate-binding protein